MTTKLQLIREARDYLQKLQVRLMVFGIPLSEVGEDLDLHLWKMENELLATEMGVTLPAVSQKDAKDQEFGTPRMQPILKHILNLNVIMKASAETNRMAEQNMPGKKQTLKQAILNKFTRAVAEEVEKKILEGGTCLPKKDWIGDWPEKKPTLCGKEVVERMTLGDKKGPVFEEMAMQLSTVDGYINLPTRTTDEAKLEYYRICPHCNGTILDGSEIGIIAEVYYHLACWQELNLKSSPLGGGVIIPQSTMPALTPQEVVELENTDFLPKKETWRDRPNLL